MVAEVTLLKKLIIIKKMFGPACKQRKEKPTNKTDVSGCHSGDYVNLARRTKEEGNKVGVKIVLRSNLGKSIENGMINSPNPANRPILVGSLVLQTHVDQDDDDDCLGFRKSHNTQTSSGDLKMTQKKVKFIAGDHAVFLLLLLAILLSFADAGDPANMYSKNICKVFLAHIRLKSEYSLAYGSVAIGRRI